LTTLFLLTLGGEVSFASSRTLLWVQLRDIPEVGAVEWGLASFVRRALREAQRREVEWVVFEIDTLGGRVDAMLFIKDLIFQSPLRTVAFVNSKAWSAGVFVALSCEKIFMTPDASMGASEPRPLGEGEKPDPKTVSALRGQIEALAQARGRNPRVFAAMVDRSVEIEELKEKDTLLTLSAYRALEWGVIDGISANERELLEKLGFEGEMIRLTPSWSETLARFLTHPAIVPLLLLLAFGGIFLEVMTPGFGVPGVVGIVAFLLFFGGRYVAGLAGWEPLLLFSVGVILLAVELLVLPGFGVVGISGIVALALSLYLVLRPTRLLFREVVFFEILFYLALMGGVFLIGLFFLPNNPIWKKLGLQAQSPPQGEEGSSPYAFLVEKEGVAKTILRPAGVVEIEGERYDVLSSGEFVRVGEWVVVQEVRGNKILVRKKEGGEK